MSRDPIPTWFFVLAAVRRGDRYLLVHEAKHGQLWYLPAGRVEPTETFVEAAKRETLEEAGIPIELEGILRIEHTPSLQGTRVRLIVSATPATDIEPKSVADEESLEAGWFTLEEIRQLPLRGNDAVQIITYLDSGGPVMPITFLAREGGEFSEHMP
jgi:phosphatase NudJ